MSTAAQHKGTGTIITPDGEAHRFEATGTVDQIEGAFWSEMVRQRGIYDRQVIGEWGLEGGKRYDCKY